MPGQNSRKRAYRLYVKCSICLKDIQEDNFPKHKLTKHLRNDESFEELRSKSNSQVAEPVNSGKETMSHSTSH